MITAYFTKTPNFSLRVDNNYRIVESNLIQIAKLPTDDLEAAWAMAQNIDHPWHENIGIVLLEEGRQQLINSRGFRSAMVGDVFQTSDGVYHVVDLVGFRTLVREKQETQTTDIYAIA